MTRWGKLLLGLTLLASAVFMLLAIMVYAAGRNWRNVVMNTNVTPSMPLGIKHQLVQKEKDVTAKEAERHEAEVDLSNERADTRQKIATLETQFAELNKHLRALEAERAALVKSVVDHTNATQATQASLANLRQQVDELRKEIREAQAQRDEAFGQMVTLQEQISSAKKDVSRRKASHDRLAADVNTMQLKLQDLNQWPLAEGKTPPPLDGVVLASRESGLAEISLGSDDGLKVGHTADVYRMGAKRARYVGRLRIIETSPEKSVGRIIPEFTNDKIKRQDRVSTRLSK